MTLSSCRQKMYETPRYDPYEANAFFEDSLADRPALEGTVPRSVRRYRATQEDTTSLRTAGFEDRLVRRMPMAMTRLLLERGQNRYDIYCAPCHGLTGDGKGMIVQRGLRPPPSLHTERLRDAPIGHFYDVITNGYGAMYSYAARVPPDDRWAIAAYLRALQLSQRADLSDVPTPLLDSLHASPEPAR